MSNRYFIIDSSDPNLDTILGYSVEDLTSVRRREDDTKYVIKLRNGDTNNYPELALYVEYNINQILLTMNDSDWQFDLNILIGS